MVSDPRLPGTPRPVFIHGVGVVRRSVVDLLVLGDPLPSDLETDEQTPDTHASHLAASGPCASKSVHREWAAHEEQLG